MPHHENLIQTLIILNPKTHPKLIGWIQQDQTTSNNHDLHQKSP